MHVVSQGIVSGSLNFQLIFHIGLCTSLVIIAIFYRNKEHTQPPVFVDWIAAVGMCLTPLAGLTLPQSPEIIYLICGFASGMGIGYFFAKWFLVYSELKTKDAYCFVLLAFSFAAIIRFFFALITIISPIPTLLIILTLPFCSLYACRNAFNPQSGSIERRERSLSKTSSYKPAVFLIIQVLVYAAIFGNGIIFSVLQNAIPGSTHENAVTLINYALRGLFPFLLFLWIASQNESSQFRSSANTVFLVLAFVLLTAWFFDGTSMVVAYSAISLARNLVIILLYLALIKLSHTVNRHPFFVFGCGRAAYELSVACGIAIYAQLDATGRGTMLGEGLIYPVAICVFIFLAGCFFATVQNLNDEPTSDQATLSSGLPEAAFDRVKIAYALSDRECEILRLLYKGHSKKGIAAMLYLSENTVRWHGQRLYKKLGIHSREELLRIVDQES